MDIEININEDNLIRGIRDEHNNLWVYDVLGLDPNTILDDIYFSEILDAAIERDQAEVERDIADSYLDLVSSDNIYYTNKLPDIKRFFESSLKEMHSIETVLFALKNEAIKNGWDLVFTKKI